MSYQFQLFLLQQVYVLDEYKTQNSDDKVISGNKEAFEGKLEELNYDLVMSATTVLLLLSGGMYALITLAEKRLLPHGLR